MFLYENVCILIYISLKIVNKGSMMAWCRTGDKQLSERMMAYFIDAYMYPVNKGHEKCITVYEC